jgi:aspartate carbamoyltransferase regulatory subunit
VLKVFVREQLPLTKLRVKTIPLVPEKQVRDKLTEDLYFIDPVKLVETILNSDVAKKVHFGLAHRVNNIRQSFSIPKHGRLRSAQQLEDRENLEELHRSSYLSCIGLVSEKDSVVVWALYEH